MEEGKQSERRKEEEGGGRQGEEVGRYVGVPLKAWRESPSVLTNLKFFCFTRLVAPNILRRKFILRVSLMFGILILCLFWDFDPLFSLSLFSLCFNCSFCFHSAFSSFLLFLVCHFVLL